jgi:transposase
MCAAVGSRNSKRSADVIHLPASVRVYLAMTPCDMRRSFDGLHALVNAVLQLDAFAGHLFVFANKRRDRVKILYWDRDGFAVWAKRLEEGTYAMPFSETGQVRREITAQELGALLSGIDLSQARRRKRYRRKVVEAA